MEAHEAIRAIEEMARVHGKIATVRALRASGFSFARGLELLKLATARFDPPYRSELPMIEAATRVVEGPYP